VGGVWRRASCDPSIQCKCGPVTGARQTVPGEPDRAGQMGAHPRQGAEFPPPQRNQNNGFPRPLCPDDDALARDPELWKCASIDRDFARYSLSVENGYARASGQTGQSETFCRDPEKGASGLSCSDTIAHRDSRNAMRAVRSFSKSALNPFRLAADSSP